MRTEEEHGRHAPSKKMNRTWAFVSGREHASVFGRRSENSIYLHVIQSCRSQICLINTMWHFIYSFFAWWPCVHPCLQIKQKSYKILDMECTPIFSSSLLFSSPPHWRKDWGALWMKLMTSSGLQLLFRNICQGNILLQNLNLWRE